MIFEAICWLLGQGVEQVQNLSCGACSRRVGDLTGAPGLPILIVALFSRGRLLGKGRSKVGV
jgi:hypothetical protein